MPMILFKLPVLPFMPPIMLAMLLPAFMPFIMLPVGALIFVGRANVFVAAGMIGCCERVDMPVPGGGWRLKPDDPVVDVVDVAGGGGSENEDDDARC